MADYLMQISYTPAAWAALIKHPQNRMEPVSKVVEKLGGKITGFWMAFGEHDIVGILQMPDNVSAASFAMAIAGGGACTGVKTTPLIGFEDGLEALKKAGTCGYKPVK
jgi:uncharacterized protein with GYD domain